MEKLKSDFLGETCWGESEKTAVSDVRCLLRVIRRQGQGAAAAGSS